MTRPSRKSKINERNQKLLKMIDTNLSKIEADNRDLNTLFKSMLRKKKGEFTASQLKELQALDKQLQAIDDKLYKMGE